MHGRYCWPKTIPQSSDLRREQIDFVMQNSAYLISWVPGYLELMILAGILVILFLAIYLPKKLF